MGRYAGFRHTTRWVPTLPPHDSLPRLARGTSSLPIVSLFSFRMDCSYGLIRIRPTFLVRSPSMTRRAQRVAGWRAFAPSTHRCMKDWMPVPGIRQPVSPPTTTPGSSATRIGPRADHRSKGSRLRTSSFEEVYRETRRGCRVDPPRSEPHLVVEPRDTGGLG